MYEDEIPIGKAKDLRGQKFGRLTVLCRVPNMGKDVAWKCKCECGTIKNIRGGSLTRGNTLSCGCYNKEKISNDLTGKRFGMLTAIKPTGKKRGRYIEWECLCDCGNIHTARSGDLVYGSVTSCGCKNAIIDITGQRFGTLTVLRLLDEKGPQSQAMWECQCDCGKIIKARGTSLRYGEVSSCGAAVCRGLEKDMTGMTFGKLTVISKSDFKNSYSNHTYWNCQCECGNTCVIMGHNLRNGATKSCGCLSSLGERETKRLLKENHLNFIHHWRQHTCRFSDTGCLAEFDFYIIDGNYIIEFDGIQHYQTKNSGWDTQEHLEKTQAHDIFKNQWCRDNGIPLIRIPYWKLDTLCIEDLMLETTEFCVE